MVKAKILNPDAIEVEVIMRRTVGEWKVIRDRLKLGIDTNYHATAQTFKVEIADIVAAIEKTIEPEAGNETSE